MLPDLIPVISAINSGDKERARRLLQPVLRTKPSAEAWYQASRVTEKPEHEAVCLKRAIALDPRHTDARRRLRELGVDVMGTAASSPPVPPVTDTRDKGETLVLPIPSPKPAASPSLSKAELAALRKPRQRKKRGTWFYVGIIGSLLLGLSCTYFVLLVLGSGIPGRLRGLLTGQQPITEINGVPLELVEDAVLKIPPSQSTPLQGPEPAANVLEPGVVHEHVFSARSGEEVAVGVQFFSPSANRVNRNIAILDPDGRKINCDRSRILQGDNGSMIVCNIHKGGTWKMLVLGIEGQSTGAYFVSVDRLQGDGF